MSKSSIGIAIAGVCLVVLVVLKSPAFAYVMVGLVCFIMYEILELYRHMTFHIKSLHDRVRRLEKAGEYRAKSYSFELDEFFNDISAYPDDYNREYDNRLESDHD